MPDGSNANASPRWLVREINEVVKCPECVIGLIGATKADLFGYTISPAGAIQTNLLIS